MISDNNKEAPFEFKITHNRLKIYNRKDFEIKKITDLINELVPVSIILSGWNDKEYVKSICPFKNKIPLTILMDNIWYGQFRQYIGLIYSRIFFTKLFNYIWVPGNPQSKYAKKLGFKEKQILLNSYCADLSNFEIYYKNSKELKEKCFPHRFLFVGRYVSQKGLDNLCDAFVQLQKEYPNDWELVCVGTGPLFESRMIIEKIIHKGFIQPNDFQSIISETGVFVLPSWEEHWGVVLHEYAATGYPLLCSKEVAAASAFLLDGKNGFIFQAKNIESLKEKMLKIVNTPDCELIKMGEESKLLSDIISNEKWNASLKNTMILN
jgi:glycosyltransferase involved in cell wall biosynthesis